MASKSSTVKGKASSKSKPAKPVRTKVGQPSKKIENKRKPEPKKPIKPTPTKKIKKPIEPKGDLLGLIEWGQPNHKGGIILQGVGTQSKARYHILMSKRKKDWICRQYNYDNNNAKEPDQEIQGLESMEKCKLQCVAWENGHKRRIVRVPEVTDEQIIEKVEQAKEPLLQIRSWEGKTPLYNPETHNRPVGKLKKISKFAIVSWLEELIDFYEQKNIWITNSGIRSWILAMNAGGWLQTRGVPSKEERDLIDKVVTECLKGRLEPEIYSDQYRKEMMFKAYYQEKHKATAPTTNGTPQPAPEKIEPVKTEAIKKHNIQVKASTGSKGGKRYSIEGIPITAIIRWMASELWTRKEIEAAMKALDCDVMEATLTAQISSGKKGDKGHHGEIPKLSEGLVQQLKELNGEA